MTYLAFDPGGVTGWCTFDDQGNATEFGQLTLNELADQIEHWAQQSEIHTVIYEDFKLFKHKAQKQAGSRMPASQAIGMIKLLIRRLDAKTVVQDSSIKSTAQKLTQMNPPSNHAESHWVDAFNHGAYYLINEGIRKTYLEMQKEQEKNV